MNSVPCEQRQAVGQSNTGSQTVAHSDLLARAVKLAPNICRVSGGGTVQRQHAEPLKQPADCMTALIFTGATQKLKTAHSRRLELISVDAFRNLILNPSCSVNWNGSMLQSSRLASTRMREPVQAGNVKVPGYVERAVQNTASYVSGAIILNSRRQVPLAY